MREKVSHVRAAALALPVALAVGSAVIMPAHAQISGEAARTDLEQYLTKENPIKANAVQTAIDAANLPEGVAVERIEWLSDHRLALFVRSAAMPDELIQVQLLLARDWFANPEGTFPTVWALDGMRASDLANGWTLEANALDFFADKNVNVVLPVGGETSFYTDWQQENNGKNYKWETFLTQELMPLLKEAFRANDRAAIFGPSMGGTAAVNLAAHHPELFQFAGSFSGYLDTTTTGMPGAISAAMEEVGGYDATAMWGAYSDPAWSYNDPKQNLDNLHNTLLYVSAGSGKDDYGQAGSVATRESNYAGKGLEVLSRMTTQTFVNKAKDANVNVITAFRDSGVHDWPYWQFELGQAWPYMAQALGLQDADSQAYCLVEGAISEVVTDFYGACLTTEYIPATRPEARVQDFERGRVYWSEATGAQALQGRISAAYSQLGGADSWLGLPTTEEIIIGAGGEGRLVTFENGIMPWSPTTGAFAVPAVIAALWEETGGATGTLGYPVDEAVSFGEAVVQRFQHGFVIQHGEEAYTVGGAIAEKYLDLNALESRLGLPISEEIAIDGGIVQRFEHGQMYWSEATGAHPVYYGDFFTTWGEHDFERGELGWPTDDQAEVDGVEQVSFQNGVLRRDGDVIEVELR